MFDDIDDVMIDDDDMDVTQNRVPSKKMGNLDLTLAVKENSSKMLQQSEVSDGGYKNNINNSTFSALMSVSMNNKKGDQQN